MSEAFNIGINYEPSYERPHWDELTSNQQTEIINGPGWVNDPADIVQFEDLQSFRCHEPGFDQYGSNNFRYYFARDTFLGEEYAKVSAFQRLKILHPRLVNKLEQDMFDCNLKPDEDAWDDLLQAYKIMSQLVDKNDPYITNDGEVDSFFLTR